MINSLKIIAKWLLFYICDLWLNPTKNITKNQLLLIRLDAIGDYVLFRNYIEVLKTSRRYKNYKITLCGNSAWRVLAENLDSDYIDDFIWVDLSQFTRNVSYRYKKLREITRIGYDVVISPAYSREFFHSDNIVKLVSSEVKIGSSGDLANTKHWQKTIGDSYYTQLIPASSGVLFEFYRNREFFEYLIHDVKIKQPKIELSDNFYQKKLPKNYAVLFIGASKASRKWPVSYFAEVASYLKGKYGLDIVLCGGANDKSDAKIFKDIFKFDYIDLVGKTSLLEVLSILKSAFLLVSNETSAPHFAIALGYAQVLVISNGNSYLRFTPYPAEITDKYNVVFHPDIALDLVGYAEYCANTTEESKLDISAIDVKTVLNKIDAIVTKSH